jgi:YggT family protein
MPPPTQYEMTKQGGRLMSAPLRPRDDYDQEVVVREERQDVVTPDGGVVAQNVAVAESYDRTEARWATADWLIGIVYFIVSLIAIIIAIRIVLKLLAANPDSGFARFIYGITGPFVAPFQGILGTPDAGNGAIFEFSSILAIAIYALVGWIIAKLLQLVIARPSSGVSATRSVGRRTRM